MAPSLKMKALFLICVIGMVHGEEPKCTSRFDYDEQMLMKLLRLEDQVNKFREFIDDMKAREAEEVIIRQKLIKEFKDKTNAAMEELTNNTRQFGEQIGTEVARIQSINRNSKDSVIAFTASTPADTGAILKFTNVVTNEGGDYDVNTGKFTCRVPGLYFFILHITKKRSSKKHNLTSSEIRKNGETLTSLLIDPWVSVDGGSYGTSTSVYVMLDAGDVIIAFQTVSSITMESWSSLSGALIVGK